MSEPKEQQSGDLRQKDGIGPSGGEKEDFQKLYQSEKERSEKLQRELEEVKIKEELKRIFEKEGAYSSAAELFEPEAESELSLEDQAVDFLSKHPYLKRGVNTPQQNPTNPGGPARRLDLSPIERAMAKEMGLEPEKLEAAIRAIREKAIIERRNNNGR